MGGRGRGGEEGGGGGAGGGGGGEGGEREAPTDVKQQVTNPLKSAASNSVSYF